MMRSWCIAIAISATSASVAAPPPRVELAYEVERDGSEIATVTVSITHDPRSYRIEERWSGSGLFALSGDMRRISRGRIVSNTLQPQEYTHQRGRAVERVVFDWPTAVATLESKGERRTEKLMSSAGDRLTELYGLAFVGTPTERWSVQVIDGRGEGLHTYRRAGPERVVTPAGPIDAVRLERVYPEADARKVRIWLSKAHGGLPVRVQIVDGKGRRTEQQLTRFSTP